MYGALHIVLGVSAGAFAAGPRTIEVDQRPSILVALVNPRGVAPGISSELVYRAFDRVVRARTPYRIRTAEQAGIDALRLDECPPERRLSCWVEEVNRATARSRSETPAGPGFFVALTLIGSESARVEVSGLLINVPADAGRVWRDDTEIEQRENDLFSGALRFDPMTVGADELSLESYFESLSIPVFLDRYHRAPPAGRILLRMGTDPVEVRVGERPIGVVTGEATLVGVNPGSRRLAFVDPVSKRQVSQRTVDVRSGESVVVDLREPVAKRFNRSMMWTGGIVAAVGVAVAVSAIAAAPDSSGVALREQDETENTFIGTCSLFGGNAAECASGNRGLLIAPFGLALLTSGAATALAHGFWADDDEKQWWWALSAAVLGVGVYGALALAN